MSAPPEPKVVGKGLQLKSQADLLGSNHPVAPFVGNALEWSSYVFDDGTTYEGLTREDAPHGKGVLVFGNGQGGGIQRPERGDRYEGEFSYGFANGLGQYMAATGEVYRGEWMFGKRHGCGALIDMKPFHKRVDEGMDPDAAWQEAKAQVEKKIKYGTWATDFFVSGPEQSARFCHIDEIRGVLQELESVVVRARMFQYKPDGEVTFRMAQDVQGLPAPVMQDPMHYPHGTGYMAPGPMGQCFPLPDDDNLKEAMTKHAHNHDFIFNQYNFDLDMLPGSEMEKAERLWRRKKAVEAREAARKSQLERRRMQRLEKRRGSKSSQAAAAGAVQDQTPPDDGDLDDSDLVASAVHFSDSGRGTRNDYDSQRRGGQPATVFASLSMSLSRASFVVANAFEAYSKQVLCRRSLSRPSHIKS